MIQSSAPFRHCGLDPQPPPPSVIAGSTRNPLTRINRCRGGICRPHNARIQTTDGRRPYKIGYSVWQKPSHAFITGRKFSILLDELKKRLSDRKFLFREALIFIKAFAGLFPQLSSVNQTLDISAGTKPVAVRVKQNLVHVHVQVVTGQV